MVYLTKTVQISANLKKENLIYRPYPRDEVKYNSYLKILSVAFESTEEHNYICNITSNCVSAERYNHKGDIETYQEVLQCFKLVTKNQDGGIIRFSNSEWFYINGHPNNLIWSIQKMQTNADIKENIVLTLTIALGKQTA